MTHEHIYVQHPRQVTMVCCDKCGFAVPKSVLRPHVVREFSLAITKAQREQLKPLMEVAHG